MNSGTIRAALAAALLALPLVAGPSLAAKKSTNVRDKMSSEQKAKLRKLAFDWCRKKYGRVHHIEIKSNGKIVCYHYPGGY